MGYLKLSSLQATIKNIIVFSILFCILQGLTFIVLFGLVDVLIVCFLVSLFFWSAYRALRHHNTDLALIVMHLATCLHMSYMVYVFGWDYGFQYYIILVIGFYYINSFTSSILKHLVVALEVLLYIFLYFAVYVYDYTLDVHLVLDDVFFGDVCYFINSIMVVIFASIFTYLVSQNYIAFLLDQEKQNELLEKSYQKDPLTALNTRGAFIANIEALKSNTTNDEIFYFAIADIDFFKSINDRYGHIIGDEVLKKLANMLEDIFGKDNVCRWGGEEFVIFGAECKSDLADNFSFLSRLEYLKTEFSSYAFMIDKSTVHASISIGCISTDDTSDILRAISKADECLYEAKNTGRNKIIYKSSSHKAEHKMA